MTRYLIEPRNQTFVKDYGFLSFTKNTRKNIDSKIRESLSSKSNQRIFDHAKKSAKMHLKPLQREQFKKQQRQLII